MLNNFKEHTIKLLFMKLLPTLDEGDEELIFELNQISKRYNISRKMARRIHQVRTYIEVNINEKNLSLKTITYATKIPKRTITGNFKKVYKCRVHEFINARRINLAVFILEEGKEITMEQLASDLGFNTIRTFNNVFRRFYKILPKEYRQQKMAEKNI